MCDAGLRLSLFCHYSELMIDPICEHDAVLSNDVMRLIFSFVVNRLKGNMSISDSGLFKFWLISNVESEVWYQDTGENHSRNIELELCGYMGECVILVFAVDKEEESLVFDPTKRKNRFYLRPHNITWGHIIMIMVW